jgi:DNA-binding NarL/FixJ family response regulator
MSAVLREQGIDVVHQGATWADAEALAVTVPDVIVVDLWMPSFDTEALTHIRSSAPNATLAVVTALPLVDAAESIATHGVDLLLSKSTPPDEVAAAIAAHARGAETATA